MRYILLIALMIPGLAHSRPEPGPFARGRTRLSLGGGSSGQFGNRYITVGGGVGYYVANGLQLGLDLQVFFGDEPSIFTISPEIRYVFWQVDPVRPYIGTFFRRQFIGEVNNVDIEDLSSVGARTGIYYSTGRTHLGVGVAYEKILECDEDVLKTCDEVYPEFGFAFSL